ncbi:uncharacterized protein B0H18DRAFT_965919 [Fomitopsis serialis]|uniref:uncharacterized protein n=1 Tax=Fomitopsis serialis TaxID=139415 RepID=UPI002007807C|nr:uncharacterized protein B0H18DRAFT_965919 [Neoantrodia serialis]KAH9938175.1 hypothetical protein B0H18DRAFT_965919 [Neoantrodia serialis]
MLSPLMLSLSLAAACATAQTTTNTTSLIEELIVAPDHVDRVADLPKDSEFVFDFLNPPESGVVQGAAGHLVLASVSDFPALVGNGVALLAGFLGPCGMNTPHTHPRATEFLYCQRHVAEWHAHRNRITIRRQQHDGGSGNAVASGRRISALNSEDPGTLLAAQGVRLASCIVAATLGEIGVEEVASLAEMIPDDVAYGSQECLTRCGISIGTQPTNEQVPRVSANALPSGSVSAWTATATSTSAAEATNLEGRDLLGGNSSGETAHYNASGYHAALTAMVILVLIMGAGYIGLAVLFCVARHKAAKGSGQPEARSWIRPTMQTGH